MKCDKCGEEGAKPCVNGYKINDTYRYRTEYLCDDCRKSENVKRSITTVLTGIVCVIGIMAAAIILL